MTKPAIASKDISVVVRGLVVGGEEKDPRDRFTERCLESIRRYLPEAEIILSTWTDQATDRLDYDVLVTNEQPEEVFMIHPGGEVRRITTNNQIITSQAGSLKASRPYILNIRSDIKLSGNGFIDLFQKFNTGEQAGYFHEKIVVLPTYNPRRGPKFLFNVCDWFYFGRSEDIRDLFDIPLMDVSKLKGEPVNGFHPVVENFGCEAYIWTTWLKKHGQATVPNQAYWSEEAFKESERSYALNTIMSPASVIKVECLKMPRAGYGARPWLSQGLYTFTEYQRLYNLYHSRPVAVSFNPFEELGYAAMLFLRRALGKISPALYKKIVNGIRKLNGSTNLIK